MNTTQIRDRSSIVQGRCIPDLYDLYDLAHAAGWEPYNLRNLGHVSRVGSALLFTDRAQHLITTAG